MDREKILGSGRVYLVLITLLIAFIIANIFIRIFSLPIIMILGYIFLGYSAKHYRKMGRKKEADNLDRMRKEFSRTLKWCAIILFIGLMIIGFITILVII